jgi:serine protease Do
MKPWLGWGAVATLAAAALQVGHAEARPAEDESGRRVEVIRVGRDGARLGVVLQEVTSEEAAKAKLAEERGALVTRVDKDSAAEKAGIKEGDVIVSYQGEKVWSVAQLRRLVGETPPGRHVALEVNRGGAVQRLGATLEEARDHRFALGDDGAFHFDVPVPPIPPMPPVEDLFKGGDHGSRFLFRDHGFVAGPGRLGVFYQEVSGQLARYFKVTDGTLLVTEVEADGPASKAGLRAGDVILKVDGKAVDGGDDLRHAVDTAGSGAELTLTVQRDGRPLDVKVTLRGEGRATRAPRSPV